MNRIRRTGDRVLLWIGAGCLLAGCASALSIRLVFPSQAAVDAAGSVVLYAVESSTEFGCEQVKGVKPDQLQDRLIKQVTLSLAGDDNLDFPSLPMRSMLVAALVYDRQGRLMLNGCEAVEAEPGDDLEVILTLECAPGHAICRDQDGDGVEAGQDCDDTDPCRSPLFKEARNMCGLPSTTWSAQSACKDWLSKQGKEFKPPFCGDGIDQDCDGNDEDCLTDDDCDGFSPPQDCDDKEAKVNPAAAELCDGVDNNCNDVIDEGCAPCDVDGDQHAAVGNVIPGCPLPKDDPDDFDAGVHPLTTTADNGQEGGTVLGALRGYCSADKEKNQSLGHRDVDHDGDGKPAKDDGCPTTICDQDGDGFAGTQCAPPKIEEDCDDSDPQVFPGAPDRCGDGVAQDCDADADCTCDKDGDRYCPPADCNDNDNTVLPWAIERCDRIDNDCDELIDEGNPDLNGQPIRTDRKLCTDDNHGKCAPACTSGTNCHQSGVELTGICACSALDTSKLTTQDPAGARVKCAGEILSLPSSPRCFGANQPALERCDQLDWDCDGESFVSGQSFVEKGKVCGTSQGQCNAGTVTDCKMGQTVAPQIKSVMAAIGAPFNQLWVCSSDTVLPVAEVCNGKDDDCDGFKAAPAGTDPGWSELNEKDGDGDGYMACSPCSGLALAPPLQGCGDCSPSASIHPGAFEACDGVDNNCLSGDEGAQECTGSQTCCASQKACRSLGSDEQNCGSCGTVCPSSTTDRCTGGNCRCGSSSPCTSNRNCISGSCQCIQGGLCGGCCAGNNCQPGTTTTYCGDNGESCDTCTTTNPCKNPLCTASGNCATNNKANTTTCPGGLCYAGDCCTGCWGGSVCELGNTTSQCGDNGENCDVCTTSDECKTPVCNASANCTTADKTNGTTCTNGLCYNGVCCQGCWSGSACLPGTDSIACGTGGSPCVNCLPATCTLGSCT